MAPWGVRVEILVLPVSLSTFEIVVVAVFHRRVQAFAFALMSIFSILLIAAYFCSSLFFSKPISFLHTAMHNLCIIRRFFSARRYASRNGRGGDK